MELVKKGRLFKISFAVLIYIYSISGVAFADSIDCGLATMGLHLNKGSMTALYSTVVSTQKLAEGKVDYKFSTIEELEKKYSEIDEYEKAHIKDKKRLDDVCRGVGTSKNYNAVRGFIGAFGRLELKTDTFDAYKYKATPVYGFTSVYDAWDFIDLKIEEFRSRRPIIEEKIERLAIQRNDKFKAEQKALEEIKARVDKEQEEIQALENLVKEKERFQKQLDDIEKRKIDAKRKLNNKQESSYSNSQPSQSSKEKVISVKQNTQQGDGYLKEDALFCLSKSQFDRQVELLARQQFNLSQGCYVTPNKQNVWFVKFGWNGEFVVERISDSRQLYIFAEDYKDH